MNNINPRFKDRIGEVGYNKYGSRMEIIDYRGKDDIFVEFENNFKVHTTYKSFSKGEVRNPYDKSVCGTGFLGIGKFKTRNKNGKMSKSYCAWKNMITRCCNQDYKERYPWYSDAKVCSEWHDFQNFAIWYEKNYYKIECDRIEIDKDLLNPGNNIYSPETCCLLPGKINKFLARKDSLKSEYLQGVYFNKRKGIFEAKCNNNEARHIYLGKFNTEEEAFLVYKTYKESLSKKLAEKYKNIISKLAYDALLKYEV